MTEGLGASFALVVIEAELNNYEMDNGTNTYKDKTTSTYVRIIFDFSLFLSLGERMNILSSHKNR